MKTWQVVVASLVVLASAGGGAAAYWWHRPRKLSTAHFDTPKAAPSAPARIELRPMVVGLEQPTDIQFVPDGGTRVVILEQAGRARLIDLAPVLNGGPAIDARQAPLVLELSVRPQGEMGLLGLAFHPQYSKRGTFYVHYDPLVHDKLTTRIAEFSLPIAELGQHVATETRVLLEFDQKFPIHQAGQVAFGPDGKLYVAIGDGSTANDTDANAQNLGSLQGKLLRLDVDGSSLVPSDNPFVGRAGARGEVWSYGLRNPWRFSFDTAGHPIIGDVGQEDREELDLLTAGSNMGWNHRQGRICNPGATDCNTAGFTEPIHDYNREVGGSITGGYVATGSRVPELQSKYVFADFVSGRMWAATLPAEPPAPGKPSAEMQLEVLGEWGRLFSTFGRDNSGNLYVADIAQGELLALLPIAPTKAVQAP